MRFEALLLGAVEEPSVRSEGHTGGVGAGYVFGVFGEEGHGGEVAFHGSCHAGVGECDAVVVVHLVEVMGLMARRRELREGKLVLGHTMEWW